MSCWTSRAAPPTHSALLDSLVGAVEEEGAEQGDAGAVVQDGQVHLRELKGCWVLFQQLPNAVKEHQEQRRLGKEKRNDQIFYKLFPNHTHFFAVLVFGCTIDTLFNYRINYLGFCIVMIQCSCYTLYSCLATSFSALPLHSFPFCVKTSFLGSPHTQGFVQPQKSFLPHVLHNFQISACMSLPCPLALVLQCIFFLV